MSVLSTRNKLDLAAVFMSLALVQPAGAVPFKATGHVDWLPVYGPVEDKTCTGNYGTKKPGDWWSTFEGMAERNKVLALGNDCKTLFVAIDPVSLKITDFLSASEVIGSPSKKVLNASPAPAKWWEKPNLLPAKPQGEAQVSGPVLPGPWICTVKIGATQTIQSYPGVLIIPDATRAFYLTSRNDPSIRTEQLSSGTTVTYGREGKPVCALEPLITLPTGASTMTMAGGGLRDPGRITTPAKPVVPAAADPIAVATVTSGVAMGILILAPRYLPDQQALTASGTIIYNFAADRLVTIKNILGLSAEQLGQMASEAPDGQTYDDYLKKPATDRARELSYVNRPIGGLNRRPGGCRDEEFEKLNREQDDLCSKRGTCSASDGLSKTQIIERITNAQACIDKRIEIMDRCFDGGDSGHKSQTEERVSGLRKCQSLLVP